MIAFGFDGRVHDLIVEELRRLGLTGNAPVVEVEQPAKECELPLPTQDFDVHEVRKLSNKCLHALIEAPNIVLDMRAQQRFHAVVSKLRLQLANRASGISEKASERRAHSGFRSRSFEQDAVENLHLIKMVALRLKELPPLLDRRFHNRVVVF